MRRGKDAKATVIIVDDDEGVRQSLETLLEVAGYRTITYPDAEACLKEGWPDGPACMLLDLRMPGLGGIEAHERVQAIDPDLPVIFLTGHADVPVAVRALKQGAYDFYEKTGFDRGQLLDRIQSAIEQHRGSRDQRREEEELRSRLATLSQREREVATLAARGMANKVIGLELGISERTVEVHRGRAMRKLDLRTAAELVRLEPYFEEHQ